MKNTQQRRNDVQRRKANPIRKEASLMGRKGIDEKRM
jgi:hypothetical protein